MKLPLKLINMSMNVISSFSSILRFLTYLTSTEFFIQIFGPRFKIYFLYLLLDLYNDLSCVPESENLKSKSDSGYEKWPFDQLDWDLVIYETRSQSRVPQSPISAISTKITTPLVVNSTETRQMDHVDYPKDNIHLKGLRSWKIIKS